MGASYFNAAYPEPWQILGVRLRPFSLGHYLKLKQLQCAFVSEKTESATLGDLLLGVAVCSMSSHPDPTQDEFWQWWMRPSKPNLIAWMFRKSPMTPAERDLIKWGRKIGKFDLAEKCKLFADYVKEHTTIPAYIHTKEGGGSDSGAHWSHAVLTGLVSQCGYSQLEAYNCALGKCLQDYLKAAEDSGSIRLATPEENAAFEAQLNGA